MKINQKFKFVNGNFDTKKGELIAVPSSKYNEVHLCFKGNMHVPFARIKLHSRDTFGDAQEVYKDVWLDLRKKTLIISLTIPI